MLSFQLVKFLGLEGVNALQDFFLESPHDAFSLVVEQHIIWLAQHADYDLFEIVGFTANREQEPSQPILGLILVLGLHPDKLDGVQGSVVFDDVVVVVGVLVGRFFIHQMLLYFSLL